jgi:hypothetical protein
MIVRIGKFLFDTYELAEKAIAAVGAGTSRYLSAVTYRRRRWAMTVGTERVSQRDEESHREPKSEAKYQSGHAGFLRRFA